MAGAYPIRKYVGVRTVTPQVTGFDKSILKLKGKCSLASFPTNHSVDCNQQ